MGHAEPLLPRAFDSRGRLQMAETSLEAFDESGRPGQLFLVHHYDPADLSAGHKLAVTGSGGVTRHYSAAELRQLPERDVTAVLECAGNGRGHLTDRAPGNQFGLGMFGQATWKGVRLADVLADFGFDDTWEYAIVDAPDSGVTKPENIAAHFAKGLPKFKALHEDTILAWAMDGQQLPAEHGGPLRLIVPGWYGIWWVKWVSHIELTDAKFTGFWQNQRYTYQDANGTVTSIVEDQLPRAIILRPMDGQHLQDPVRVSGVAWSGEHQIAAVNISIDDGRTWTQSRLTLPSDRWAAACFECEIPVGLPRGLRRISAQAIDNAGRVQPWTSIRNRLGYGNNDIQTVTVDLSA